MSHADNLRTMSPLTPAKAAEIMEAVMMRGDLSRLTVEERAKFCSRICESLGLNPMTRPLEYIELQGKLTLYARKDATDQLRKLHGVSVTEIAESERDGVFCVTAYVRDASGRTDAAKGAVNIANLKGDMLANALMKAETKAKRRATLSICGLGFLDETEIETIPNAKPAAEPKATNVRTIVPAPKHRLREPVYPRGVPKNTVRDRTGVVWDETGEREHTHEEYEQQCEDWGDREGEKIGRMAEEHRASEAAKDKLTASKRDIAPRI